MGQARDIDHIQTPTDQRRAAWWMMEHACAEQAVTIAARMMETAPTESMRYVAQRLLDRRLDHLERVEDVCDATLREARAVDPDAADMAERHYIHGDAWRVLGEAHGLPGGAARARALYVLGVAWQRAQAIA